MVVCTLLVAGCTSGKGDVVRPAAPAPPNPRSEAAPDRGPASGAAPGRARRRKLAPEALVGRVGDGGDLEVRTIPGSAQRFAARPAIIWLPPVLRRQPRRRLPVLVMVHGTPGGPTDWVIAGNLRATADRFAAAHGGVAPIIVMPDVNGTRHTDTECVRTSSGADVFDYLQRAVPTWVTAHLPADQNRRRWAIAGLSSGGTCAAAQALSRPADYRAFADFSGLEHPTLGRHNDPAMALRELFGGSVTAFDEHDPLWLSHHRNLRGLSAWFECGTQDTDSLRAQALLAAAEHRAGAEVRTASIDGGHAWSVWAAAFARALPWLWTRMNR